MKKLRNYNQLRLWSFVIISGILFGFISHVLGEYVFDISRAIRVGLTGALVGVFLVIGLNKRQRFFLKNSASEKKDNL